MTIYVTFGQRYRHEPHPHGGHPDGWFEFDVENWEEAQTKVFEVIGPQSCTMYGEEHFEATRHYYPLGCLKRIPRRVSPVQ